MLLAVYGCVQGVRALILRLLRSDEGRGVWLIPLRGHREDAEYLVRWGAALCRWGYPPGRQTCIVNVDADAATCDLARRTCESLDGVRLIGPEELTKILIR